MALPEGVTTCTVVAGVPVTHTGAPVKTYLSIEPSVFLVHTATGIPLVDFLEEQEIGEGVAGQVSLPHTDQAGFQDENGNAYTNWYYTAKLTYRVPSGAKVKAPKTKVFQLVTGQDLVDLDKLPGGTAALPYSAPTAKVDAFNGRTGTVTLQESDLPTRLSEAELSATIGHLTTNAPSGGDDTAHLQARINAAAASGKPLLIPEGNYTISASLTLPSNVTVLGVGPATYIKAAPGTNAPVFRNADQVNGNTGIHLGNLYANGDKANQTGAFSVAHFIKVTESSFRNLTLEGGRRNAIYPTGNRGEGLELEYSNFNFIENVHGLYCDYDAVKLRTSDWNRGENIRSTDCGKGALQLAFVQGLNETLYSSASKHNVFNNIQAYHSTGIPGTYSPQCTGLTLHCASENTITNLVVYGTQNGMATAGNDVSVRSNVVQGGIFECRVLDFNLILGVGINNVYDNFILRPISGASKKFYSMAGLRNTLSNCQFGIGDATGTWTGEVWGGSANSLLWNMHDSNFGGITDSAAGTTILELGRPGNMGFGTTNQFGGGTRVMGLANAQVTPTTNPTGGVVLYADGDGTFSSLKARTQQGATVKLAGEIKNITADYTATRFDRYILAVTGASAVNVNIGNPSKGSMYTIKKLDSGAGTVTITPGSGTVEGVASLTLPARFDMVTVIGDGTSWHKV